MLSKKSQKQEEQRGLMSLGVNVQPKTVPRMTVTCNDQHLPSMDGFQSLAVGLQESKRTKALIGESKFTETTMAHTKRLSHPSERRMRVTAKEVLLTTMDRKEERPDSRPRMCSNSIFAELIVPKWSPKPLRTAMVVDMALTRSRIYSRSGAAVGTEEANESLTHDKNNR